MSRAQRTVDAVPCPSANGKQCPTFEASEVSKRVERRVNVSRLEPTPSRVGPRLCHPLFEPQVKTDTVTEGLLLGPMLKRPSLYFR